MANHKSSEKRARQTEVRRARNRQNMSAMRTQIKKLTDAITKKDLATLDALFVETQGVIARTAKKGTIHKNNMSRRISRLSAAVSKAKGYVKPKAAV